MTEPNQTKHSSFSSDAFSIKEATKMNHHYLGRLKEAVTTFPVIGTMSWLFYFIAYYYVIAVFESTIHFFPFTVIIMAFTEMLCYRLHRTWDQFTASYRRDLVTIMMMILLQGLALSLWGFHPQFEAMQAFVIHLSFVLYIAMRSQNLVDQQLNLWVLFDLIRHFCWIPFQNILIRPIILWYHRTHLRSAKFNPFKWLATIISILSLFFIFLFVMNQLGQLSPTFAQLSDQLLSGLLNFIRQLNQLDNLLVYLSYFILSIPIGLWLSGLIFGSLLHKPNSKLKSDLLTIKTRLQIFPKASALLLMSILIGLYFLFFTTAFYDLVQLLSVANIQAPDAANVAISGFWQFIYITLLNLFVTWFIQWLYDTQWVKTKAVQYLMLGLYGFSLIFASLAVWKTLGVYVLHFGWTPLRLLSGWFAVLMFVALILIIIQHFIPKFNAYRWIISLGELSFTAICYAYPLLLNAR